MLWPSALAIRTEIRRLWTTARAQPASNVAPSLIFLIFALVPAFAGFGGETYLLSLFTRVMIFAIAAIALDLIVGYGALVSFGHAAFMGLGAYAVGILAFHGVTDALISLPLALALAAAFAWATGLICLRTKGLYFIMITLSFGQMAFFTASSLAPYGGDDGLTVRARDTLFGLAVLRSNYALYYAAFGCLLGAFLLCRAIISSRFGRVLRGSRDNATRMAAIGFEVFRYQLIAYVISGALAGLSGFLLANATEFVSPAYMSWQRSAELIIMVLFGGIGTLYGAIIGTTAFLLTEEWLPGLTENWKMIFGPLLVIVVLFARGGLVGLAGQVMRAVQNDPVERASQIARAWRARVVDYASQHPRALNDKLLALFRNLLPTASAAIKRLRTLLQNSHEGLRQLIEYFRPRLRQLSNSTFRSLQQLRAETLDLISQLTRKFRDG